MTARERDAALAAGELAYEMADWVRAKFDLPKADLLDMCHVNYLCLRRHTVYASAGRLVSGRSVTGQVARKQGCSGILSGRKHAER